MRTHFSILKLILLTEIYKGIIVTQNESKA